jgi:molecular chaperone GrpE
MQENKNNKAVNNKKSPGAESVTVSRQEYEGLAAKAAERDAYYDKYLRAAAEFENAKKRMERERADLLRYANEGFLLEFLPILDNLETAERHIKEAKDFKAVQEGVDMIQAQIQKFLKEIGIERIKTVGEKFDPHLHEPMETVESQDDNQDGLVVAELKPGYKFNGRLLRPAAVRIGKKKQ